MIPFVIVRKILLSFAPLVLFYLFKKMAKEQPKRKLHPSDFDPSTHSTTTQGGEQSRTTGLRASKSQLIEGEIVEEK